MTTFDQEVAPLFYDVQHGIGSTDVVMLHGNLASSRWWEPTIAALRDQAKPGSGRAITIDWRGCGRSNHLPPAYTWHPRQVAQECESVLLATDTCNATLVRHSAGGLLALYLLEMFPERFQRAVLLDPVTPSGVELTDEILAAFQTMAKDRELATSVLASTIRGVDPTCPAFQRLVDDAMQVDPAVWTDVPKALAPITLPPDLSVIETPITVIHGADDTVLSAADSQQLAKDLVRSDFLLLPEVGHSLNWEQPTRMAEFILGYQGRPKTSVAL